MQYFRENYTATWHNNDILITAANGGNHTAFWSAQPDGFTDDNELPSFEKETVVSNPLGKRRVFFHIFSDNGYSVVSPRNLIPDGVSNLRDLGGYNTADMQHFVKHGMLYRSGILYYKEQEKMDFIKNLGLRQIVDFRMPEEATGQYADPVIPGADHINISPLAIEGMRQFVKTLDDLLNLPGDRAVVAYQDVYNAYSTMMFGSTAYQEMFRLLLAGKTPLLYHCSAGKDRTGIASALILAALGVPRETIIYDYMLTNEVRADFIKRRMAEFSQKSSDEAVLEAMRFFISVNLNAIESTFAAIDGKYSAMEEFFEKELFVTENDIEKLKNRLLVKHHIEAE